METESSVSCPLYKYARGRWKTLTADSTVGFSNFSKNDYARNLHIKTIVELVDLQNRLKATLNNKALISKLPDNGVKLKAKCLAVEKIISFKRGSKESVASVDINDIEWHIETQSKTTRVSLNDDFEEEDDCDDPLELIATHSLDVPLWKAKRENEVNFPSEIEEELKKLEIDDQQLEKNDASSHNTNVCGSNILPQEENYFSKVNSTKEKTGEKALDFSAKLLENLDSVERAKRQSSKREPFKPFRTLRNHEVTQKLNTSAMGPIQSNSNSAKLITLQESLKLLAENQKREAEILFSGTSKALASFPEIKIGLPSSNDFCYRDKNEGHHIVDDYFDDDEEFDSPYLLDDDV